MTNRAPPDDPQLARVLARFECGQLSGQMTLMYWLKMGRSVWQIESELARLQESSREGERQHFAELGKLLKRHREGCLRIAAMVGSGVDSDLPARTDAEGIAFCRRLFDWSCQQSGEASVALYSLGSPALLSAATDEIVLWLGEQAVLRPGSDALEIGCGIGRFEEALAPVLGTVTGVDISTEMVQRAQARCRNLPNVSIQLSEGKNLSGFEDASFDLVLAIDSFPYLFQSGWSLLARHFEEARRVLRPGGSLVVLELSYGRSLEADRADFAKLALASSLEIVVNGDQPFHAWDGNAFVAQRGRT
ncbi:class I SAM-dependent methyltransferase [Variovorax sp. J22P271]|uniref:class I SAM-dependent methyltransferase n=1 Tax=Variovorax davisae TaxID=3053515 RepID=UPI0025788BCF|nr:class I SAM-dependent methyltransferase [Variovorax sp. J22P271]MDM0032138.1 class I SAM-dependent methyltransferase [Variovorax sp. J22P271]